MPHFPKEAPSHIYWCPNCEAWFEVARGVHFNCLVNHGPGLCCHHAEREVEINARGTNETLMRMGSKLHDLGTEIHLGWGESVVDGVCEYVRDLQRRITRLNDAAIHVVKDYNSSGFGGTIVDSLSDLPAAVRELQAALWEEPGDTAPRKGPYDSTAWDRLHTYLADERHAYSGPKHRRRQSALLDLTDLEAACTRLCEERDRLLRFAQGFRGWMDSTKNVNGWRTIEDGSAVDRHNKEVLGKAKSRCQKTKPAEQGYGICKLDEGHDGPCEFTEGRHP